MEGLDHDIEEVYSYFVNGVLRSVSFVEGDSDVKHLVFECVFLHEWD
jgi:hypothetical protein